MNNKKLKKMIFGGLFAASLMVSAVPAMARDNDHDHDRDSRWEHRDRSNNGWWGSWWNRGNDRYGRNDDNGRDWAQREYGTLRGSQRDFDQLEQARQQALYDASRGASRDKIARDNARVDELANQMRR